MRFERLYSLLVEAVDKAPIIGIVGVSNDLGNAYMYITKDTSDQGHGEMYLKFKGSKAALDKASTNGWADSSLCWRYRMDNHTLYIWDKNKYPETDINNLEYFISEKLLFPIKHIINITGNANAFTDSHFRKRG
jgi:hypothetical protein